MKKEIVALIKGEIEALMKVWTPPQEVECERQEKGLELLFTGQYTNDFFRLEEVVNQIKPHHKINLVSFFKAYDFTQRDIWQSELLWLSVLSNPVIEVKEPAPIKTNHCPKCGRLVQESQDIGRINLYSRNSILKKKIMAAGCLNLFQNDLVDNLRNSGISQGIKTIPCSLEVQGENTINDYCWVYSDVDLGLPIESIEYGEKCSTCGIPKILSNRAFLKSFHRDKWKGADFCTSTFYGIDFLYISQRVFRFLDTLPDEEKEHLIFEPVNIIGTNSGM